MALESASVAPVLATPDSHVFEDPSPSLNIGSLPRVSDEQLYLTYEVRRTVAEIRAGKWRRVALQFPDEMLVDAPRVCWALSTGLRGRINPQQDKTNVVSGVQQEGQPLADLRVEDGSKLRQETQNKVQRDEEVEISILGDTSYGSCCVDEIAAEHVAADVVVHYGRSCLSPTSKLPVIYVFTAPPLDMTRVVDALERTFPVRDEKILLMADVPYCAHVPVLWEMLQQRGYTHVFATEVTQNPSALLPNRTLPEEARSNPTELKNYRLFHIARPPTALLMILTSRVSDIHVYSVEDIAAGTAGTASRTPTSHLLRRRYAIITSLSTARVWGILINTLSVKNFLHVVDHVKSQIAAAGKKSYTFVVGKINPAKVANFAEIGGWVVIGCWESSLVEDKEFYRPLITPFELELALKADEQRIWTGEWESDFRGLLSGTKPRTHCDEPLDSKAIVKMTIEDPDSDGDLIASDDESAPPEFDLRTGRYISHAMPAHHRADRSAARGKTVPESRPEGLAMAGSSTAVTKRVNGDLSRVGGVNSPGAEFLRSQRTWQGLGSDYEVDFTHSDRDGVLVEEGRSGVARGYTVGSDRDESRR